jgi:hypothetical protein
MTNPVASNPENACYAIWIAWGLSWWLAAVWSSRAASRASAADELPYRLLTTSGFILLFAIQLRRGYHGPLRFGRCPPRRVGQWLRFASQALPSAGGREFTLVVSGPHSSL